VNAYLLTYGGCLLLGGRLGDLYGHRRLFLTGLSLFTVASLLCGLSTTTWMLVSARAVQGVGGAVTSAVSFGLVMTLFTEPADRAKAMGIMGFIASGGGSIGVLLGGVITDVLSWRWILFINLPIGLLAALASQRFVAEGRNPERGMSFDLMGAITATLGLSVLVLGIVRTDVTGWGAAQTLGLLAAGLVLLAIFVGIEGRFARHPLMPLRIYASRTLTAANLVVLLLGGATFGMWFFLSLYLQQVLGYSPLKAGFSFLPMTLCIVAGSVIASRAVSKVGVKTLLVAGMTAETAGLLLFTGLSAHGGYVGDVLAASLLSAIGIGLSFVPATISAVAGVDRREAGLASGLVNTSRLVGGALGLAILAALAAARTSTDLHHAQSAHAALTGGFDLAFVVAAGFAALGGLIALFGLPRVRPPRPAHAASPVAAEA
jgi:EmrB/QacA subfamily drug resistance transporter